MGLNQIEWCSLKEKNKISNKINMSKNKQSNSKAKVVTIERVRIKTRF